MGMTRPQRIEVEIGELVLHGFEPADRHRIGDAVQRQLQRLFAEHGLGDSPVEPRVHHRMDAGRVHTRGSATDTGRRIADAIHGAVTQ